jgi:SAM-dependent methyltransferase
MDPLKSKPEDRRGPVLADARQESSPAAAWPQPAWSDWLATPAGQYVMRWETEQLSRLVVDMFGYYALQLGFLELDALQSNRMPHRIRVSLPGEGQGSTAAGHPPAAPSPDLLVGGFEELPLESQSVDLVVLPHQLEFSAAPHQILREVDRVLRPEGRLVVVGMNPLSLWGLRQSLARRPFAPFLPPTGQLIGIPRLRDWMKLLSFEIDSGHYGCYAWPCRTQRWLDRLGFLENAGDRWWPICGAVYMVSAVKRVRGMRLIGPAWKRRPAPKAAPAVAVSGRVIGGRSIGRRVLSHPSLGGDSLGGSGVSGRTYSRGSGVILPFRRRS